MPVKAVSAAARKAETVDYCETHGEGCKSHRYPHPKIYGHKLDNGRWFMTPDQSLDAELIFAADMAEMLRGMPRAEFLAQPCKVIHMPPVEYRKKFDRSPDRDQELEKSLLAHRAEQAQERHAQEVREGYGDAVPAFEEIE